MSDHGQSHDNENPQSHAFEIVKSREAEGLILYLKSLAGGWTFRIIPVRDPNQPRFWCLRIEPCAQASAIAPTSSISPYYTAVGMSRDLLMETLETIKSETSAWLAQPLQRDFRRWLVTVSGKPLPAEFEPRVPPTPKRAAESVAPKGPAAFAPGALASSGKTPRDPSPAS